MSDTDSRFDILNQPTRHIRERVEGRPCNATTRVQGIVVEIGLLYVWIGDDYGLVHQCPRLTVHSAEIYMEQGVAA